MTGAGRKHWLDRWAPGDVLTRLAGIAILGEQTIGHAYGLSPSLELLGVALWAVAGKDGLELLSAIRGGGSQEPRSPQVPY